MFGRAGLRGTGSGARSARILPQGPSLCPVAGRPGVYNQGAMNAKVAKCLLVSKVLVADGMMTDDERAFLETMMTALGLDADERRGVIDLDGWDEAEPLVRALSLEERQQLVEQLVDAASADGHLSARELATIKRVAAALGVTA